MTVEEEMKEPEWQVSTYISIRRSSGVWCRRYWRRWPLGWSTCLHIVWLQSRCHTQWHLFLLCFSCYPFLLFKRMYLTMVADFSYLKIRWTSKENPQLLKISRDFDNWLMEVENTAQSPRAQQSRIFHEWVLSSWGAWPPSVVVSPFLLQWGRHIILQRDAVVSLFIRESDICY